MKHNVKIKSLFLICVVIACFTVSCNTETKQNSIWQNKSFAIYSDSVTQTGGFVAKILSATEITSNYKSPANEFLSPSITFKFSINGNDNEIKSGTDHHFTCLAVNGSAETPLIKFGTQYNDTTKVPENTYLVPGTQLKIRLDMREVLSDFDKKGFYTCFNGEKIFKESFKGVYVAGNTSPLLWNFDNIIYHTELQLLDNDKDGIYEVTLKMCEQKEEKQIASHWKMSKDVSAFPQYQSDYLISDAVYNMALEEMQNAIEPDSTFRTGKEWAGVWTRDISYSIILSMSYLQPKVAMYSLLKKVKNGRIIQDTGTGGAYPVSTDRMIWASAAWEIYKATGDKNWLKQAFEIIKNSVDDDMQNAYDKESGLVRGESSFLDWREQTYPKWMQPADIFESICLGTNAIHYRANIVLSEMANALGNKSLGDKYVHNAQNLKANINKLWLPNQKYFGQFLYGRNFKIVSPRSEALGEALSVIYGLADSMQQIEILQNTPVTDFGASCIFPQISGIPPYHNNAVWPFVESYWALAAAKVGNEQSLLKSIASIYRPAALFLTNKENFVATNGDYAGTQINSSNMLWSLSGNIALVHKIFFGIEFKDNALAFHPFVPKALKGKRTLNNFKYRNAILNIEMEGFGNQISTFEVDGKDAEPLISAELTGTHSIKILLTSKTLKESKINEVENYFSPSSPVVSLSDKNLTWLPVKDAKIYFVYQNGIEVAQVTDTKWVLNDDNTSEYQVVAVDFNDKESFTTEPILVTKQNAISVFEVENFAPKSNLSYKGFSGKGFVEISTSKNLKLNFSVNVPEDGLYSIDFQYSNGNGPTNTENKCAIRTLALNNNKLGTYVFPQRGKDEWSNWGFSNSIKVQMQKGKQTLSLTFEPANNNMNGEINVAMLDYIRLVKIN